MPEYRTAVAPNARTQLVTTSRGLIAESVAIASVNSSGVIPTVNAASGTMVGSLVGLRSGDVVTNLSVFVTVAGTSLSFVKLGLFTTGGVFLGATASVSATFNSGTGYRTIPLTSPYTIPADAAYYATFLQYGSGATGATLVRGWSPNVTASTAVGTGATMGLAVTLQTDISGNISVAGGADVVWFGVS